MVLQRRPLTDAQFVIKEAFNRIVASLLLLLCLPTLLLVALCIRLDSPGPVVFRQERTGYNDRRFLIFKFRTMHAHMADPLADQQTTRADPRITRVGKVLRKLSIDELPQLLNVIIGDMALVGPRPHAPNTKAGGIIFDDVLEEYAQRHRVKPGITGWAQVNGWRGETQVPEQVRRRVEHDLYYIDHWSVWLDIRIIVLTVFREIFSKHAF
jgi:exopolysaccharide biosynthesis polyprenyl glycosylphosphotransferase